MIRQDLLKPPVQLSLTVRLRESLGFAAVSGFAAAAGYGLSQAWGPRVFSLTLWGLLAVYVCLLQRWRGAPRRAPSLATLLVLAIPLAVSMTAQTDKAYALAWLLSLSALRNNVGSLQTGKNAVCRAALIELALCLAPGWGISVVFDAAARSPGGALAVTFGLGIWLFFLLQSLVVVFTEPAPPRPASEVFARAQQRAETLLSQSRG